MTVTEGTAVEAAALEGTAVEDAALEGTAAHRVPRAWVLNLDAELELRAPLRYQPSNGALAACEAFEPVARRLLEPGDLLLSRRGPGAKGIAKGYQGAAWCPTPSALAWLERSGASVLAAPALECLQRVNHRRFHMELGSPLTAARLAVTVEQARDALRLPSPQGWIVKRGFGFAGRGNRRFPAAPSADDWRWLEHAFHDGPVQIEPWLQIVAEYSIHGWLQRSGELTLGAPCVRASADDLASYVRVEAAEPPLRLAPSEVASLERHAAAVGRALSASGYFGPFGIDAFSYLDGTERRFNPRSEINARFTLAFAVGMGRPNEAGSPTTAQRR